MNKYNYYINEMRNRLPLGDSFDLLERSLFVGRRPATMYFVDGLVERDNIQRILTDFLTADDYSSITAQSAEEFLARRVTYLDAITEADPDLIEKSLYSGLVPLFVDGLDKAIMLDLRNYPTRSIEEPDKEKTLRGAKDGFCETFMSNIALIRRRIRDNRLICNSFTVGKLSKTDICLIYMKGIADDDDVQNISKRIDDLDIEELTAGEQSLIEALNQNSGHKHGNRRVYDWFNPFPKVRYTQRPDVAAAHICEGKIAIIIDNTPTVILLPTSVFEFAQDMDDYYFPVLTGSYMRLLRLLNFLVIIFITPIYLLLAEGHFDTPAITEFLLPDSEAMKIPVFWQLLLLELAIDGLKLASLNTPSSLGMSLSVIGALLLGELSINSGWLVPQTILLMAVVALAGFTQPSIELGYAVKFMRVLILIGAEIFSIWGALMALALSIIVIATTKTIFGKSYLYPVIPFNGKVLMRLMFRRSK